jgi:hypothetical protein
LIALARVLFAYFAPPAQSAAVGSSLLLLPVIRVVKTLLNSSWSNRLYLNFLCLCCLQNLYFALTLMTGKFNSLDIDFTNLTRNLNLRAYVNEMMLQKVRAQFQGTHRAGAALEFVLVNLIVTEVHFAVEAIDPCLEKQILQVSIHLNIDYASNFAVSACIF